MNKSVLVISAMLLLSGILVLTPNPISNDFIGNSKASTIGNYTGMAGDGDVWCRHTTYATCTAGTGTYAVDTTRINGTVGQKLKGTLFTINQTFLRFDTSAIPDTATLISSTLYTWLDKDNSTVDFNITVLAKLKNNTGTFGDNTTALTVSDYIDTGASNRTDWNYTMIANYGNTSQRTVSQYYAASLINVSWVNKTGPTSFELISSRTWNRTAPTGVGGQFQNISTSENTNKPYLLVTFNSAPIITDKKVNVEGTHNATTGITWNSIDADTPGDAHTWSIVTNATGNTFVYSNRTSYFNWTPTFAQTNKWYWVNVTVSDGIATDINNVVVWINNTAPVMSDAKITAEIQHNSTLVLQWNCSDANYDYLNWATAGNATGMTNGMNTTGYYNWTPSYAQSQKYYDIIQYCNDSYGGTQSDAVRIYVNNTNPIITNKITGPITISTFWTHVFTTTDANGDTIIYTVTRDNGLALNIEQDGTLTYDPSSDKFNITVMASDGYGSDSNTFQVINHGVPVADVTTTKADDTFKDAPGKMDFDCTTTQTQIKCLITDTKSISQEFLSFTWIIENETYHGNNITHNIKNGNNISVNMTVSLLNSALPPFTIIKTFDAASTQDNTWLILLAIIGIVIVVLLVLKKPKMVHHVDKKVVIVRQKIRPVKKKRKNVVTVIRRY